MCILKNIRYQFKELKDEDDPELTKMYDVKVGKKPVPKLYRDGVPQGSPLSPILATLALENWEFPKGLTMYADDGLFIGTSQAPVQR